MTLLCDKDTDELINNWLTRRAEKHREILFRKFTIRKCSNHRKHTPHLNYVTSNTFKLYKKIVKGILRCEKMHEKINPKATLKLIWLEKRWLSLKQKLDLMMRVR